MSDQPTGFTNGRASAPDIRALLAASFDDERESSSAMLARAMLFAQDADRKLAEAKNVRSEAERFRSEMQRTTVEQTEALVRQMRDEAEHDRDDAQQLRDEAESTWEAARAELERANTVREEAEQVRFRAQADAEAYRHQAIAEAEREAINIKDTARSQVNAELALRQEQVDEELRKAMAAIEKMQAAVQAELDAQQMYTEALRFRASAPNYDEEPASGPSVEPPATRRRPSARKPRA